MDSNQIRYVPVLRWKRGEQYAVRELREEDKDNITPMIELVPSNFTAKKIKKTGGIDNKLVDCMDEVESYWGTSKCYIDLLHLGESLCTSARNHPLSILGATALERKLPIVFVTGLRRHAHYQTAIRNIARSMKIGVSVRLTSMEVEDPRLGIMLDNLLTLYDLKPTEVDLIIDYQFVQRPEGRIERHYAQLPYLQLWRSFTMMLGAFPVDLSGLEKNRQHVLPRLDWQTWQHEVFSNSRLLRRPDYGDYTIQHPFFREPVPGANVSASIRYTSVADWVIMRGEGLRNPGGPGYRQYPAQALLLSERPEFCGAGFSYGDGYIAELSAHTDGRGTPETLLRAGVNHHITYVVRQMIALSA